MTEENKPLPWDALKGVDNADRRRYYLDIFPDAIGIGRTLPWGFILDHYLPDLIQRRGEDIKTIVADLVEDEDELKQESDAFKKQFDQYVDTISSLDPHFAAIANTTKGVHFINVIAILEHTPLDTLPGIPQDNQLGRPFWVNLQKIIEAAKIE